PLSYTVGPPNVTKEISTKFKRPVTVADRFVEVTATISELNETSIKLSAIVRKESGKVAAVAEAYCVFINQRTHGSDC
ncbi:MAG: hypothetical protein GWO23_20080, partial [Gammaproteobacteria bacterium]|nr:hypothetical protein [Gammaproteobacteria bacterium]